MYAAPARATLSARDDVVLEAQDGNIEMTIGEKVTCRAIAIESAHHLQAEIFHVKMRGRFFVLGLDCNVPDLCHGESPLGQVAG